MAAEPHLCLYSTYHGRCWGTWGELSRCPQECPLCCPLMRPSAVSRPLLPLSLGSRSGSRGMETLRIYLQKHKQVSNLDGGLRYSVCKRSPRSSWERLTWRRRFARRSLPPCSLLEDEIKLLEQKHEKITYIYRINLKQEIDFRDKSARVN